jgi:hypothetical protein
LVNAFDGKPNGADHERKGHEGRSEGSASPAEGKDQAEGVFKKGADDAALAEGYEQQIAGHHGR